MKYPLGNRTPIASMTVSYIYHYTIEDTQEKWVIYKQFINMVKYDDFFTELSQIQGIRNRSSHMWIFRVLRQGYLFKYP